MTEGEGSSIGLGCSLGLRVRVVALRLRVRVVALGLRVRVGYVFQLDSGLRVKVRAPAGTVACLLELSRCLG